MLSLRGLALFELVCSPEILDTALASTLQMYFLLKTKRQGDMKFHLMCDLSSFKSLGHIGSPHVNMAVLMTSFPSFAFKLNHMQIDWK